MALVKVGNWKWERATTRVCVLLWLVAGYSGSKGTEMVLHTVEVRYSTVYSGSGCMW